MNDNILVQDSKINRQGLFANRDFKEGEAVTDWDTQFIISPNEYDYLSDEDKEHISKLQDGSYLIIQPPERFINHSCEPNTFIDGTKDVALRDIKKGEEITSDYSTDSVGKLSFKCNCGTPSCKGVIYY